MMNNDADSDDDGDNDDGNELKVTMLITTMMIARTENDD